MMAIGFLVAAWITARRMDEEGLDSDLTYTIMIYVVIGGVAGSKLYFAVDNSLRGEGSFASLLLSRAGITWYGGLIGGVLSAYVACRVYAIPFKLFADCGAVATAVGQALGRVGCFLVGDDYGRPTDLPWGLAFPKGMPPTEEKVHPTQLYEVVWLLPVAALLWSRRRHSPFLFGEYLVLNGAGRLAIEHWRINPELALGLTQPQWIGIALMVIGSSGWIYYRSRGAGGGPGAAAQTASR
jgi:phosphatidylglycerol:prolipoprotein diacylglycerol transferase